MGEVPVNSFLRALPAELQADVIARSRLVDMPVGTPIFQPNQTPRHVHFMEKGIASVVTSFREGASVEVGLVGHESFPEKLYLLGPGRSSCECYMQIAGSAYRLPYEVFRAQFLQNAAVQKLLMQHAQAEWLVLLQLCGCNRAHEVEARLARWLLMVADRVDGDIALTQEFLAFMLGTRRSTVTLVAGTLQKAGTIAYRRGRIQILNRDALLKAACECYEVCREQHHSLVLG